MSKLTFKVPEMSCGHCVEAISTAVRGVEGVGTVEVDLDTKQVVVDGEGLSEPRLRQAISDAGYEVAGT